MTLGLVDRMRDDYIEKDHSRGIFLYQGWALLPGTILVASGGIPIWHMPALVETLGKNVIRVTCEWSPELAAAWKVWKKFNLNRILWI
jgi:ribulose 1,5-bisphosphate carboxylase large subunit-like protein